MFHAVCPGAVWPFPFNAQSWLKNRQGPCQMWLPKCEGIPCSSGNSRTFEQKHRPEGLLKLGCGHPHSVSCSWTPEQGISPEVQGRQELMFYSLCIPQCWPSESGSLPADHSHKPERAPGTGAPTPVFLGRRIQTKLIKSKLDKPRISFMIKTGGFDKLAVQKAQN